MSLMEAALQAAREAAALMRDRRALEVHHKGAVDLVTQVDLACEHRIREILGAIDRGIPILAEEAGGPRRSATRWLVDPLDGTTNFVHGVPMYGPSIALQVDGELRLAVVVDAVRGTTWAAERGRGATMDGQPIRVSACDDLSQALLASGFPYDRRQRARQLLEPVARFMARAQGFRRMGAAALDLAMLATGWLDGMWEIGLNPWDMAAGALLIEEAGGRVTDLRGGPFSVDRPRILASNGRIHDQMVEVLAGWPEED